jgi:S-DNA-T family DNA segregation ATPase FtsK/SpoIIIE
LGVATLFITNVSLRNVLKWLKKTAINISSFIERIQPRPAIVSVPLIEEDRMSSPIIVEPREETLPESPLADASANKELSPLLVEDEAKPEMEKKPERHPVFSPSKPKSRKEDLKGYRLPDLSLLQDFDKGEKSARIEPSDYSRLLEETLRSFGVEASVLHVERGPTVTRYELQPAKGVKVSKIVSLTDDLALALAAASLRIEAPIPGKSAIGIEVPNSSVAMVYFKDMLTAKIYRESPLKMILALGKDITGQPIYTDLKRMPHLLIAGATGSGKTVCINTLIASILFKATPLEVQFLMIDPKRVELTIYDGIPHLIQEVVTDPKQAAKAILDVLAIMDERYTMFKEARVRNLEEYNIARSETPLPFIVVLIDELADLMMLAAATVETSISRMTALARAAGIHLIVATQRPSVDVITGIIKANIPSRIAFAVSSMVDSRTILDTGGAEKLLGRGDMLFAPIDAMKPVRLQGAYVGLHEIEALVSFWSEQPPPENLVQFPQGREPIFDEGPADNEDELYSEAKDVILRTGQASVSTLQRKMKIGYARAGRLMDIMEKHGVVSGADGSKPRKILIPNPYRQS